MKMGLETFKTMLASLDNDQVVKLYAQENQKGNIFEQPDPVYAGDVRQALFDEIMRRMVK